jgi:hypothetical protein
MGPYKYVVSLKVKQTDLFRPCLNNEIGQEKCQQITPEIEQTPTDDPYKKWFLNWFNESHKLNIPFTGLGYTYDVNKDIPNPYGVSEYVIKPHSDIQINHIYTIKEYLEQVPTMCSK